MYGKTGFFILHNICNLVRDCVVIGRVITCYYFLQDISSQVKTTL
jgi:hypothetical protein